MSQDLHDDGTLDLVEAILDLGHVPDLCSPDEITNMRLVSKKTSSTTKKCDADSERCSFAE